MVAKLHTNFVIAPEGLSDLKMVVPRNSKPCHNHQHRLDSRTHTKTVHNLPYIEYQGDSFIINMTPLICFKIIAAARIITISSDLTFITCFAKLRLSRIQHFSAQITKEGNHNYQELIVSKDILRAVKIKPFIKNVEEVVAIIIVAPTIKIVNS